MNTDYENLLEWSSEDKNKLAEYVYDTQPLIQAMMTLEEFKSKFYLD